MISGDLNIQLKEKNDWNAFEGVHIHRRSYDFSRRAHQAKEPLERGSKRPHGHQRGSIGSWSGAQLATWGPGWGMGLSCRPLTLRKSSAGCRRPRLYAKKTRTTAPHERIRGPRGLRRASRGHWHALHHAGYVPVHREQSNAFPSLSISLSFLVGRCGYFALSPHTHSHDLPLYRIFHQVSIHVEALPKLN